MRSGTTLAEVLLAFVCGLLVVQLSLTGLARVRSVALSLTRRSDTLAALRTSRVVLRRELRFGVRGTDWVDFAPDSIALRAFRGVGIVCPEGGASADLVVAWSGMRAPDPSKDSVLLLTEGGAWLGVDLLSARSTPDRCVSDAQSVVAQIDVQRWQLSVMPEQTIVLARLFERGSYHVSGDALRYRRGRGGRQPLIPEVFEAPPSGFVSRGESVAIEWIRMRGGEVERWSGRLGG